MLSTASLVRMLHGLHRCVHVTRALIRSYAHPLHPPTTTPPTTTPPLFITPLSLPATASVATFALQVPPPAQPLT